MKSLRVIQLKDVSRKAIAVLLSIAMAFCLSACEVGILNKTADGETDLSGNHSENPEPISVSCELFLENSLVNGILGAEYSYPVLTLSEETESNYPKLAEALENYNDEKNGAMRTLYESLANRAVEEDGKTNYGMFFIRGNVQAQRSDSRVVSLVQVKTVYQGVGGVRTEYFTTNLSPETGETLSLSDVLEESCLRDPETLKKTILECMKKAHPTVEWTDPEAYLDEIFQDPEQVEWTLAKDGIRFWFPIGTVCNEETGLICALVPYGTEGATVKAYYSGSPEGQTTDDVLIRDENKEAAITTLCGMTVYERICQLFVVLPEELSGSKTSYGEDLIAGLEEYPVGGVLFVQGNITTAENTVSMTRTIAENLAIQPFLCVDEEGGRVTRLGGKQYATRLNAMYTYKDQGESQAYYNARTLADNLYAYGFNLDFAPVADVWTNPSNQVIGDRAYSDDPEEAADLIAAAIQGFHDGGVFCCLKHFPGHGDTSEDSHTGAAIVHKTLEELRETEFIPFLRGIAEGTDMIMVGHLTCPEIDNVPATTSKKIVTEILRNELGYDGVIVTDSLKMGAVSNTDSPTLSLLAFNAGCDVLLAPSDLPSCVYYFCSLLKNGSISIDRLNESVLRILKMKKNYINFQNYRLQ